MHTTHSNTQYENESKHSEMGPVRQWSFGDEWHRLFYRPYLSPNQKHIKANESTSPSHENQPVTSPCNGPLAK